MAKKYDIICLMGPTASGKTDLAIALSQQLPCDIISVDSAMVYQGMDIGTAKPSAATLAIAPHRLINICLPHENYSAGQFCADASREIDTILANGRIPLLVGGTMLYFRALQQGIADLPTADPLIRQRLQAQAQEQGWLALHKRLQEIDPASAARIHPHDPQRLQRALEVYEITGNTLTALCAAQQATSRYQACNIILAPGEREILHQRIAMRFYQMLADGLVQEVANLLQCYPLDATMPSMRTVGYRQVCDYLAGEIDYQCLQERGVFATRQLAKRQLTWLRSWSNATWFDSQAPDLLTQVLKFCAWDETNF